MNPCRHVRAIVALSVAALAWAAYAQSPAPDIDHFLGAASSDERQARAALDQLAKAWKNSYTSMIIDMVRFMKPAERQPGEDEPPVPEPEPDADGAERPRANRPDPSRLPVQIDPGVPIRRRLIQFLERQTGQSFGDDLAKWRQWMWKLPYDPHPDYAEFKGEVYSLKDRRFEFFFGNNPRTIIRLDEIDWGGVTINGIPPLNHARSVSAGSATYLKDSNVVFGISINGEHRAYPKRILAWHEMAKDRVGGVELTIVYCTLCGTVLPYESVVGGRMRTFGTSGLLYRSNKLMFDEESASLWSTLEGRPVVGPLVDENLELTVRPSVTTTWREWRDAHPDTTVLSLDTGFKRDYGEGVAYRDYFATDRLMFEVPELDRRLRNKAEVLVFHLGNGEARQPIAIAVDFLKKTPVYQGEQAGRRFVVVTSTEGANRVFDAGNRKFVRRRDNVTVAEDSGSVWKVTEDALERADGPDRLSRIPANRAFWFGWYAQFPKTVLIK